MEDAECLLAEEQVGAGNNLWTSEQYYTLREVASRNVRKFNTTATDYLLTLNPQSEEHPLLDQLGNIFDSLVDEMTSGMADIDLVRFVLQSRSLQYPISLPFMPRHELNAERILGEVQRVLQSNEQVNLRDGMQVHVVHVGMPQGGVASRKRKHYGFKLSKFLDCKHSVLRIKNKDFLCLARAIVTDIARQEKHPEWNSIRQGRKQQQLLAQRLHQKAGVPEALCGLPEVAKFQNVIEDYQIIVLSAKHFNAIIYEGPRREKQIYLYHHENHFDVITSVSSFLGRGYWCLECKKGYDTKTKHRCNKVCKCCFTDGCQGITQKAPWRECGTCHRMFAGDECYTNHCRPNKEGQSVCQKFYKCKKCNKVLSHQKRRPEDHMCGEKMCWNCEEFVDPNTHRCYMRPITNQEEDSGEGNEAQPKRKKKNKGQTKRKRISEEIISDEVEDEDRKEEEEQEYLFFDIESRQDEGKHIANLLIVQDETGFEMVFKGDGCIHQFGTWLLDGTHQGAIVIAHNLRGYDGILLCEYFYEQCLLPSLILNGAIIMSMELTEAEIKFRASLNFLPMPLKALPKTFGLTELKKGYFPHFFNRKENQQYVGPLPPIENYDPDGMSTKERQEFLRWYEERRNTEYVFDFEKEIEEYCRSDVDILRRCCLQFKQLMEEACNLDPFKYCVTIASACNRVFRQEFLEKKTIGLIPAQGYQPARKYSVMALQWLAWIHHQSGDRILHALNGGEQRIDNSYVDGYDPTKKIIYEFMGCLWHGCRKCYLPDTVNPVNDTSMEDLLEGTIRKVERFKKLGF